MKNAFQRMTRGALVGGLLLMTACGGVEEAQGTEALAQEKSALETCRSDARQFASCVHEMNLLGLATCQANEYRQSYNLLGQCSASTYHTITWTCCTQQ
ncbi:hypothetical protein [Hyalangium minutum]|uniref:Lipoprotein n=1 Tax=Hyalangium minutum TaxID=394096 RepID=A0A085W4Y9_9BACT|nr:hypothetical protein [Hyalangium minutum]KFE62752.1 hypothetical protein DB31_3866 [Hyalangium minutum]